MADCLLCGLPFGETRARSEEHVYPRWLKEFWPNPDTRTHQAVHIGPAPGPVAWTHRSMSIGAYEQVVRQVCEPCNGWMNDEFESPAQRVFPPLFRDATAVLGYGDQAKMAGWAWKVAVLVQYLSDSVGRAVSESERRSFRYHATPPARSRVWVGVYERDQHLESWVPWTSSVVGPGEAWPEGAGRNVYSVLFTVGNLFFLVFGTSSSATVDLGPRGDLAHSVASIWPADPASMLHWPPGPPVTDAVIDRLVESFLHLGPIGHGLERGVPGELYGQVS
jgi:hypothetical protein